MATCTVQAHPIPRQTSVPVSGTLTISTASTVQEPQVQVSATLHVDPLSYTGPFAGTVVLNIRSMSSSGTATLSIRNTEFSATAKFTIEKGVVVSCTGNISLNYPGITPTVPLFGTATLNPRIPCTATLDIRNMEHFRFFTHCTSIDNRKSIQHMGYLRRNRTPDFWNEPLAGPNAPMGVWFAVTLRDGDLPEESPFGTERVLVPVQSIERHVQSSLKPVLYFETQVDSEDSIYILFLLRGDDHAAINWCVEHNLEPLDIHNNQWLCFDMCGLDMRGLWITWANHPQPPLCWVYVFIADNVCIKGCDWDNVVCTRYCSDCQTYDHTTSECPKTEDI